MTRQPASIGDALIFMTKVALVCVVVIVGAWAFVTVAEQRSHQLLTDEQVALRAQVDAQQITITDLSDKLNKCLAVLPNIKPDQGRRP
jgi:hypothetical protein